MTRTKRATFNFATALAGTVTSLSVALVTTPLVLRALGEERLGAFRVTVDWFGHLSVFDLGVGGALGTLLARAVATGDAPAQRATLVAGVRAYLYVALATLVAGGVLAWRIGTLAPVTASVRPDLVHGCLLMLLAVMVVPLAPFRALTEARQQGYRTNLLLSAQLVTTALLSVLAARAGFGITGQAAALTAATLPVPLLLAYMSLRHTTRPFHLAVEKVEKHAWRSLWTMNVDVLIVSVCGRVSLMSDSIIVSLLMGPAAVIPLVLTQRFAQMTQGPVNAIGNASWAALAELFARGEHDLFRRRLVDLTRMTSVLSCAALAPIVVHNREFVTLWVGHTRWAGGALNVIVTANVLLQCLFALWGWAFQATGEARRIVRMYVAAASVNLAASIVLAKYLGLIGPPLGTLVSFVCVNVWVFPWMMKRSFGVPIVTLARSALLPVVAASLWACALWCIARLSPVTGWLTLIVHLSFGGVGFLGVAWLALLSAGERDEWRGRVDACRR